MDFWSNSKDGTSSSHFRVSEVQYQLPLWFQLPAKAPSEWQQWVVLGLGVAVTSVGDEVQP